MRFFSLLASAALAGLALAQSNIAFTSVPASVTAGGSYQIQWGGGDGTSPVTITLRMGALSDIQTVQVLTTDATGSSYTWKPSSSLVNGDDYTLQITQGLNSINFSGDLTVSGGIDPVSASISSILASASSAIASANATISSLAPITSAAGMTTTGAVSSMGTGTALPRNTTFSSASLGTSKTETTSTTATTTATTTGGSTSSSSSSSSGTNGADGMTSRYSSPMALFCAILAAIAYAI